ncbi:MAG: MMPL family transporter, partial [Ktedonobacterales bacterium]
PTLAQLQQLYATGAYKQAPGLGQLVAATTSGDTTVISVKNAYATDSPASKALIDRLRAGDNANAGGLKVMVGGYQAVSLDFTRYLYSNFPKAILFVLAATFLLLLVMFRSLLLPLKAVLMNVLSVSAAYGVLVFVFQWGHFSSFLGFTSVGFIDSIIPILLFCILFGLSMDYEVFLLSRIREEWLRTGNNRQAVAMGLEKTGGVITNAALLFVIVTGAFTFTRVITTKEIGLGMTVAVLVDATINRSLLVPATMRLLGRWNWWLPGRPIPQERVSR